MPPDFERYNLTWTTLGLDGFDDSAASMPLGNGDFAANIWVEKGGDIMLLPARGDAWDNSGVLLKLGRVRLRIDPLPDLSQVEQTLDAQRGRIVIRLGPPGRAVTIELRVDTDASALWVSFDSDRPVSVSAALEVWRTAPRTAKTQTGDIFKNLTGPDLYPTVVGPDQVMSRRDGVIAACHHNASTEHDAVEINLRLQGLGEAAGAVRHPMRGRTFGIALAGEGFTPRSDTTLDSPPANRHTLLVFAHSSTASTATWHDEAVSHALRHVKAGEASSRQRHESAWYDFWHRSWLEVSTADPAEADAVDRLTRAYALQRFINAAAGRAAPIKHNGSLFTVGRRTEQGDDPDFRRWGGPCYWFMNQRLVYWPMLAAGDFDLIDRWFALYADCLPLQRLRTLVHYGHAGAHYPEAITPWGGEISAHYGWTPFVQRQRPEAECPYVSYYWSGAIELLVMMIESLRRRDSQSLRAGLVAIADAVITFYDLHYPRGDDGRIRFEPAQSLETWHEAIDPLPEIAGLRYLLPMLLDLPAGMLGDGLADRCRRMLRELPDLPVGVIEGQRRLLPGRHVDRKKNTENPELYAVFPYRLYGVGKPDLQLAEQTFDARQSRSAECWSQDDIQLALLGRAEAAAQNVLARAAPGAHSQSRFPVFFDAHKDWQPDIDHGGVMQLALQLMLMQTEGRLIRLLPAWPRRWSARFRLHAPYETVVEGEVIEGRITRLSVTPESRRADVVVMEAQ